MGAAAGFLPASRYDQDLNAWSEEQARLLTARRSSGLDWDNLAEEIASVGRSERSEIRSRLIVLLHHLLKWQFQPARRKTGWEASILEARQQIKRALLESPSLKNYPASVLDEQYRVARLLASDETALPLADFPTKCPYSPGDVLDETFFPGEEF